MQHKTVRSHATRLNGCVHTSLQSHHQICDSAGVTILTWPTPLNFLGKSIILLHLLAAATSVARLGAIARPDQQTGAFLLRAPFQSQSPAVSSGRGLVKN
jgi:hypothetical protein